MKNKAHIIWWQTLNAADRYAIMKKFEIKKVTDKLIYKMFTKHVPDNMKGAYQ